MSSGCGRPIPDTSTTDSPKPMCIGIYFINSWFKPLEVDYYWRCQDYPYNINELFNEIRHIILVETYQYFKKMATTLDMNWKKVVYGQT